MKRSVITLIVLSFIVLGSTMEKKRSEALIADKQMMQVGIIVKDIENSVEAWTTFLGKKQAPEIIVASGHDLNPTKYKGKPTEAKAKLAFFQLDNITVELIEPIGGPSTWQEFLDTKGEGIHHIAFDIKGMDKYIENFESNGIPMIQHGGWDTGEYGYFEGHNGLALTIELLEHYNQ
jgi:hypothetical protein